MGRTDFRGVLASYGHREAGCVFCAGGQRPGAAGERACAVHRRCPIDQPLMLLELLGH
jgi:hypothetical protein